MLKHDRFIFKNIMQSLWNTETMTNRWEYKFVLTPLRIIL